MKKYFVNIPLFVFCTTALAHWGPSSPVPVDRLVQNLTAFTEEHPDDAEGWYALGRIHSMAYVTGSGELAANGRGEVKGPDQIPKDSSDPGVGPDLIPHDYMYKYVDLEPTKLEYEQRVGHLTPGLRAFKKALDVGFVLKQYMTRTRETSCRLSYAYLLEKGAVDAGLAEWMPEPGKAAEDGEDLLKRFKLGWAGVSADEATVCLGNTRAARNAVIRYAFEHRDKAPNELRTEIDRMLTEHWLDTAMDQYLAAFDGTFDQDIKEDSYHMGDRPWMQMISYEAGRGYLRLALRHEYPDVDRRTINRVNDSLRRLEERKWGGGYITPIIFSLNAPVPLESLLAPETIVSFDLDGTGREQSWPWVSTEASILVWDPEESGEVASGRQLFGSVTWWLFFDDGYRAMDALDDNRDGELSGDELVGLAVWTDANSNGVSDAGEVVSIGETGIEAISCRQTDTTMGMPANLSGLRMTDGRVLPTYDWVAEEVEFAEVAGR